jgi:hypothetical protein
MSFNEVLTRKLQRQTYEKQNVHRGNMLSITNISLGFPPRFKFAFCDVSK